MKIRGSKRGSIAAILMVGVAMPALAKTKVKAPDAPAPAAAATPGTKPIVPVYRNIRPFYRNIRPFWGRVNPFYRNIRGFWGDVDPFYRNIRGFWGGLDPSQFPATGDETTFSAIGPMWDRVGNIWTRLSNDWIAAGRAPYDETAYGALLPQLRSVIGQSDQVFGDTYTAKTGAHFVTGFARPLMAEYGIDINDPASLRGVTPDRQAEFFMAWYDGLMAYSGTDRVDHWMKAINWSPALSQTQGSGKGTVVGLVDFYVGGDAETQTKIIYQGGVSQFSTGHGVGVGSLIVASHDRKGIMGIAPDAKLATYNPFDTTGTADWADVRRGMIAVINNGATVVNLSLGVPGYTLHPEWTNIFKTSEVDTLKDRALYVIAAGNDGITQTTSSDYNGALDSTFIVVGSVDPGGTISEFSNRPGTACLLDGKECKKSKLLKESGYLMDRFIVAPGELILVADGQGGVVRQSGTSLAAPLVAGAVTLIQDRWPWLRQYPRDVAHIILNSARDLGEPGVDPVYGVGMLDVEASQSPLDFSQLKYYLTDRGNQNEISASSLKSGGLQPIWSTRDMYFVAFEKIDQAERDFLIPLSSRLFGTMRDGRYFQKFVYDRMVNWIATPGFASQAGPVGFSDVQQMPSIENIGGWSFRMAGRVTGGYESPIGYQRAGLRSSMEVRAPGDRFGFNFGHGDGALAIGAGQGFALTSDFDPYSGGANPLLGFASGGTHIGAFAAIAPGMTLSVGATQQQQSRLNDLRDVALLDDRLLLAAAPRYAAAATSVRLDYRAARWLGVSAAYTRLDESNALLGVRSIDANDFAGGSVSSGMTIGADATLGSGVSLFGTASAVRATSSDRSALRIGEGGTLGTAYQVGIGKAGVMGKSDRLRLSLAQPLTIERGTIDLTMVQVVDRQTGAKGVVTQSFDIAAPERRRLVGEAMYGIGIPSLGGEIGLFGRAEFRAVDAGTPRVMAGAQARLVF